MLIREKLENHRTPLGNAKNRQKREGMSANFRDFQNVRGTSANVIEHC